MENSFINNHNKKEKRNGAYGRIYRGLNHSNSQPIINHNKDKKLNGSYFSKKNNYSNNNNSLLFPRVYNNNKSQTNNSLDSSYQNYSYIYTKDSDSNNSISLKLIKNGVENNMYDVKKRISKLIDNKLAAALGNKKMMEEMMKKRIMSKMRRKIDRELYRERSLDDLKLRQKYDEIEKSRENIRLMRNKMLSDIKNRQIEDLEEMINSRQQNMFLNPYNFIPPQFFMNPFNQGGDGTGDLFKFLLFKRFLDQERDLIPLQYLSGLGFPLSLLLPPKPIFKIKRPMERTYKISFPDSKPIIIRKLTKHRKYKGKTNSSDSPKGIPFKDPLENYLGMIQKLRKKTQKVSAKSDSNKKKIKPIKLKKKKR